MHSDRLPEGRGRRHMALPPDHPAPNEREIGRAGPRGALGALTHMIGRMGLGGASVALVCVAIVLAEIAHILFVLLRGDPYFLQFAIDVAAVTFVVATPIIVYAQFIIRQL